MTTTDPLALPVYNPNEPAHLQENDWSCSQDATEWGLWSYGRTPDDDWMESSMMTAGVIDPAVGLTQASGAGLAQWLNDEYGEFGYVASNADPVSFDDVASEAAAGAHPLMIGGRTWCHWTGVAGYEPNSDVLLLRNPAPGYYGVHQTLNRTQFSQLGSFSLVRLTHPEAEAANGGGGVAPTANPVGIDVASHQGRVDWAAVAASGCTFAFAKATGGAWYSNPYFPAAWSGMQTAGLKRGAYHYAFESTGQAFPGPGPQAEAQWFLDHVLTEGPLGPGDMLVLDIEEGHGPLGEWALAWLSYVESRVGFKPLLYTGAWFSDPHGFGSVPGLAEYGLWLAAYQSQMPPPCAPWSSLAFWQFSDSGSVPGVSTLCDTNRFNGSAQQMAEYGLHDEPSGGGGSGDMSDWDGAVGSGLLEMMAQDNTLPAQRYSTWLPLGAPPPADVEECLGQNGVMYRWALKVGHGWRYRPS